MKQNYEIIREEMDRVRSNLSGLDGRKVVERTLFTLQRSMRILEEKGAAAG